MPNINAFSNCVFVQFSIDENGSPQIPYNGIKQFGIFNNNKYLQESFIGVKGGNRYGLRKLKDCTHWGIVDATDEENPVMLHYAPYPQSNVPQVIKSRKHYIIVRNRGLHHFNLVISDYRSHGEMKSKYTS